MFNRCMLDFNYVGGQLDPEEAPQADGQPLSSKVNHTHGPDGQYQGQEVGPTVLKATLVSGFGGYHTACPQTQKPKPYTTITPEEILTMAQSPSAVHKDRAQWMIPSTVGGSKARKHQFQRKSGQFWMLWADLDQVKGLTFLDIVSRVKSAIPDCTALVYTTASATQDTPKCRVLVPLSAPVQGRGYSMMACILNNRIEKAGLPPDRVSERPGQLCYLPNRGKYYAHHITEGRLLDPGESFAEEIQTEQARLEAEKQAQRVRHQEALKKAQTRLDSGTQDPIDAYRQAYPVETALERYGYQRKGNKWISPMSESGKPGVSVRHGKWYSHHSSDSNIGQMGKDGGTWGDAFDLFVHYEQSGDFNRAVGAVGEMFTVTDPETGQTVTLNKANQREYMRQQDSTGQAQGEAQPYGAPVPLPDELPPVAPFDYELLPDTLRPWVQDIAERMQSPPDFVAVAALGGIAAIIGRKVGIRPQAQTDWTVVCNLWVLVIGRPGVLKSPSLEAGLAPLKKLIAEANDTYQEQEEQYKVEALTAKLKQEAAEKTARKMLAKDPESDLSAVLAVDEEPVFPALKRYQANDCTAASLGELLRQNPNGLLVFRDEVVSLLKSLDRDGQEEGRGFYLTAWNGDSPYTFDRIGRGMNLTIPAICLSVLGGTQPGRLSEYISHAVKGGSADDGLIQRFGVMVWPDIPKKWKNVDRMPNREAKDLAYQVFEHLDKITPADIQAEQDTDLDGNPDGIPYLRFDPAALELFTEWRASLEQKLRSDGMLPALESHFSKYRKLIPSLALIFHLVDGGAGPVSEAATLRALAWSQYLESHAYRAYGSITSPEVSTAKAILQKIQKGKLSTPFTSRDVWRPGWSKLTDRDKVLKGLKVLEDYSWITAEEIPTKGRPKTVYQYNGVDRDHLS